MPAQADQMRILALGDSLTAGYGLPQGDGFTDQLQAALQEAGYDAVVLNAGVSGDTTAGGLARLDWALADAPDIVIVELGANDALRGIDPASSRANLSAILAELQARDLPTLLAGMLAPRNLGADYVTAFDGMYGELAEEYDVPLYPFFLEGVAAEPELNQPDGIHPNASGVAIIVDGILPDVTAMLDALMGEGS
ncbi:MAG: arylesterase [Pseudomonadota bacterium]